MKKHIKTTNVLLNNTMKKIRKFPKTSKDPASYIAESRFYIEVMQISIAFNI